jgi:hypothetical protein
MRATQTECRSLSIEIVCVRKWSRRRRISAAALLVLVRVIISVVFRVSPGGGAAYLVVDKKNTQCGWEMKRGRKWHAHKQRQRQVNETNKWIAIDWQHTHIKSNAFSLDHCVHVTYSSWRFFSSLSLSCSCHFYGRLREEAGGARRGFKFA